VRSGTLAPHLVVGFGEACRIAKEEMEYDHRRVTMLAKGLINGLLDIPHVVQNRDPYRWYLSCVNLSFAMRVVSGVAPVVSAWCICL